MVEALARRSDLALSRFGVSGSLLVDLHRSDSDVDIVVYGVEAAKRVQHALRNLLDEGESFHSYTRADLKRLYVRRELRRAIAFRDFMFQEQTKSFQGRFLDRDYFVRCVKDWREIDEQYGDLQYIPAGRCAVVARIDDDSESLLTPCRYMIQHVRILRGTRSRRPDEIVSYRGRFTELARKGDRVMARGRLELVRSRGLEHCRMVVGEDPTDTIQKLPDSWR
jgi:predicted nucleotidyltransferase